MAVEQSLEDRVAALEKAFTELRGRMTTQTPDENWLEQFKGAFRNDPDFAEVIQLGREYRDSDRPVQDCENPGDE